ncbi:hypothetical protein [Streptomyces sp. NPDC058045]|uniref:hypothetical protein n=1 Tax=Streptomyces sp. NPDC058045 TaxID=3346311 RepID=UPI0036EA396C
MSFVFRPDMNANDRQRLMRLPFERFPVPRSPAPERPDWAPMRAETVCWTTGISAVLCVVGFVLLTEWRPMASMFGILLMLTSLCVLAGIWEAGAKKWARDEGIHIRSWQAAIDQREQYVRTEELSDASRQLIFRARSSVDVILYSAANTRGLLDTVKNQTELPMQLWIVAQDLALLQGPSEKLRIAARHVLSADGRQRLDEQQAALNSAFQTVTKRVEALEQYAARTRKIDQCLAEAEALGSLGGGDLADAISRVSGNAKGMPRFTEGEYGQDLQAGLASALEEARSAGRRLEGLAMLEVEGD